MSVCTTCKKIYTVAHINRKHRGALHSKSLAKPFAKRKQDKRYWSQLWRKLRKAFLKQHPVCAACGWQANVVDHIRPVTQGGAFYDVSNLQPLCTSCHNRKSAKERHGTMTQAGPMETTTTNSATSHTNEHD